MTTAAVEEYDVILSVGDTTFLDYRSIKVKREGYGPTGNGGNGLILHSALAIEPEQGQTLGLLWQKLWNREHKPKPPQDETPQQKKQRQASARKAARQKPFSEKESYKWFDNRDPFPVYAVYATEINCLEGETPLSWMLLTTEVIEDVNMASTIQLEVLKAKVSQKIPSLFTVAWAVEAVAYLGGYLEHRRKTPIGIQVQERGWLKLHDLCEGWQLARNT